MNITGHPTEGCGEARQRVAVVTGASRGIGAATAIKLASQGYLTVLAARSQSALEQVSESIISAGGACLSVPTDLAVTADLDALVDIVTTRFGRLDALVNNAGVLPPAKRAEDIEPAEWRHAFEVNVTATWYLTSRFKRLLASDGPGVVVNVTSVAAFLPSVGLSAYNASKAAVTMLTRTLAVEWARDRIRVVGVAPGKVNTDMVGPILAYGNRRNIKPNPLDRVADPTEVADLIAYLIDDRAAYITGSIITIDGGETVSGGADLAR
ncbi:SDR family NAD(P)-dependent oxidoreductase [Mycobacterium sp. smrl_JER01]|uniref:SDR family NAD(P)-dependent oxidoreductase n=1 Tax=Mycobacterium sp. smrl_JER01 TaxID=3402633 RepID=UPI003AC27E2C